MHWSNLQYYTSLFFYDILILCEGTRRIVEKFKNILELFCKETIMIKKLDKSTMLTWGITEQENRYFTHLFHYWVIDLDQGLNCLDFHLKSNL
jgi:hypothetical protein